MIIASCTVLIRVNHIFSLKDKRSEVKKIIEKCKHKFNISIAEVDLQDSHKEIAIGFAGVTNSVTHGNSIIQNVINFIEVTTDGDIYDTIIEIL